MRREWGRGGEDGGGDRVNGLKTNIVYPRVFTWSFTEVTHLSVTVVGNSVPDTSYIFLVSLSGGGMNPLYIAVNSSSSCVHKDTRVCGRICSVNFFCAFFSLDWRFTACQTSFFCHLN